MHSIKEDKSKIRKLEEELKRTKKKLAIAQEKVKGIKGLKQRIRELEKSRDSWKAKLKVKQLELKSLKAKIARLGKAKGHHYATWLVSLCVLLRIQAGCSYGSICKILGILNSCFGLCLERLPCENTIQNWVSKMGLFQLLNTTKDLSGKAVSLIIDESIRLGQEKLLLILSIPYEKLKTAALGFGDVEVIFMKGSLSWTGDKIHQVLEQLKAKHHFEIKSIVSDQDGKLLKASRLLGGSHIPDISHAIATCLKRVFDNTDDFKEFKQLIASYTSKAVNQALSYLSPPKQRSKARFMNLSRVVKWAKKLLARFDKLNEKEATFFKDLSKQAPMIAVLTACLSLAEKIALPFKTQGLCTATLEGARQTLETIDKSNDSVLAFSREVEGYLAHYQTIVDTHEGRKLQVSSEIIESMFGKYKSKANNYALTGLTTLNLELPLYGIQKKDISNNILEALETISLAKLSKWKDDNSTDNQVVKRINFFKN